MEHNHEHEHGHLHFDVHNVRKAFIYGIALNAVFVIVEAIVGYLSGSLAVLADAGHNLADTASLIIALLGFRLALSKPTPKYTYGYKKATVLAAFANALILLVTIAAIIYEAIERFSSPVEIDGKVIMITAGVGILINGFTAMLFFNNKEKDLNVKGAYLHLAADALVSLGVVVSGAIIMLFGFHWIDSVVSLVVAAVIFASTWSLLRQTLRISLDGVPYNINSQETAREIESVEGVKSVHHLHIWALSTMQNALTAHIVLKEEVQLADIQKIKAEIRHRAEHLNIQHCTLEMEISGEKCENVDY
ncbi:MAG: cation diffusion facilitator family transporter [Candidatus Fibromonas sp.]|jgi:cobalt-zinc-cadmium efflux system protein|nr:cation diffusion facilitator family transporter [Candidatus Fibromonas sp.]